MRQTIYFLEQEERFVLREEVVGRESGFPPILIHWIDANTGEHLGTYSCDENFHKIKYGPMFS